LTELLRPAYARHAGAGADINWRISWIFIVSRDTGRNRCAGCWLLIRSFEADRSKLLQYSLLSVVRTECCWKRQQQQRLKCYRSYGTSPATWDHTVLSATRHKWTCPALTAASKLVLDLLTPQGRKAELT